MVINHEAEIGLLIYHYFEVEDAFRLKSSLEFLARRLRLKLRSASYLHANIDAMAVSQETFLPQLAQSFDKVGEEPSVSTRDFAAACGRILPIFDHLGMVTACLRAL